MEISNFSLRTNTTPVFNIAGIFLHFALGHGFCNAYSTSGTDGSIK